MIRFWLIILIMGLVGCKIKNVKKDNSPTDKLSIMEINDFVDKYSNAKGLIKGGSLCFYGHWFGRPYDNFHKIVNVQYDKEFNKIVMRFDNNEKLTIWNPTNIQQKDKSLEFEKADKILWEWYYYGKAQMPENLYYIEIIRNDTELNGKSNVDWYKPSFKDLDINKPALFLGGY